MKGISIIVILSIVWSIVSAIIEKRQKAKTQQLKEESLNRNIGVKTKPVVQPRSTPTPAITVDPEIVRVEALRRKRAHKTAEQIKQPPPLVKQVKPVAKKAKIAKIQKLHKEACVLPPTEYKKPKRPSAAKQISRMLRNRRSLRTAVVLSEIIQKPVSLR